jgi:glycosyltransferase involved in cell wall biosynthesis
MVVPGLDLPTLCHFQDPWPYRPEAWSGPKDRLMAWLKRRAHAQALRRAECAGWTSAYLRDLICGHLGIRPKRSEVFYNGVPEAWVSRATGGFADDWSARPMELVSVSNVAPYKRQSLVIEALPQLIDRPGLRELKYRIVGHVAPAYRAELESLASRLGVTDHVVIEGRVDDARVQELYARTRCFVLMSVCESFGIPAVEAMSFGTPVVTSDCCAMPEVCGPAADLSPADDLPALVERLARALTDAAHAEELRTLGADRVRLFTWEATGEKMAQVLEAMTAQPAVPTAQAAA